MPKMWVETATPLPKQVKTGFTRSNNKQGETKQMTHFDCPNKDCDSKQFIQHSEQTELVTVDENGEPESFEGMGEIHVLKIECADCETVIFEE